MEKKRKDEREDLNEIGMYKVENEESEGMEGIEIEEGRKFIIGLGEKIEEENKKGIFIEKISREGKGKKG